MKYIVRADYYPNGEIIPLGITDCHGNSLYVREVITTICEENSCRFNCRMSDDREITLVLSNNKWIGYNTK